MKARIATVLSLTGVLVAGSAAALVNNQVLRPTATATPSRSAADSIVQSQFAEPPVGEAGPVNAPPAATQATYMVAGAAITLDVSGDTLTVVSVAPAEGWSVVSSIHHDPTTIEVGLQSGTTLVEFHASLIYGVVNTAVETTDLSAPSPTTGTTVKRPGVTTHTTEPANDDHGGTPDPGDDDDDDDDDDDEEFEDD